jgi:dihydropteroate synthase
MESTPAHPRIKLHRLTPEELQIYPQGIVQGEIPDFLRPCVENFFRSEGSLQARDKVLPWGKKTWIMGILNVTPDSFYDGGKHQEPTAAVDRGLQMAQEGAEIIDVGGESTRPGSDSVPPEEQIRRTLPVIRALASKGLTVSIDTSSAQVAQAASDAGASIVNDVTGLTGDPEMIPVVRKTGCAVVIMHLQGTPRTMQVAPRYDDVMEEITRILRDTSRRAIESGIDRNRIVIDPGLGFGKRFEDNIEIVQRVAEFRSLGFPVLIGASRKSFIGTLVERPKPEERLYGSLAIAAYVAANGAHIVRVHDVKETRDVIAVIERVRPK